MRQVLVLDYYHLLSQQLYFIPTNAPEAKLLLLQGL